jgi:uncharacterized membrane protein YdjX (TVP38/TMEM64 family)
MDNRKKFIKIGLFISWMMLFVGAVSYHLNSGNTLSQYPKEITHLIENAGAIGPILYIVFYLFRPLIFFPATLLTAISGALFGPVGGIIYTMIGENLSANFSFIVGRYFMKDISRKLMSKNTLVSKVDCSFRDNGFISVLIMRLVFMPFDLVSYMSGACDLKQKDFALGTVLGIIPGLVTFVLIGSSFSNPYNLLLAVVFLVIGILISRTLKKKKLDRFDQRPAAISGEDTE